jgi:hypothetical protein
MAIKLGHDKGQRANICKVTSLLATDYMCIELFCLIDVATGADLRKLKCKARPNYLPVINFSKFMVIVIALIVKYIIIINTQMIISKIGGSKIKNQFNRQ